MTLLVWRRARQQKYVVRRTQNGSTSRPWKPRTIKKKQHPPGSRISDVMLGICTFRGHLLFPETRAPTVVRFLYGSVRRPLVNGLKVVLSPPDLNMEAPCALLDLFETDQESEVVQQEKRKRCRHELAVDRSALTVAARRRNAHRDKTKKEARLDMTWCHTVRGEPALVDGPSGMGNLNEAPARKE